MPGEAGYSIGITGWLPIGQPVVDKGHAADFSAQQTQLVGNSKGAPGIDIGIAAGRHNSIHVSYFQSKQSGNTVAPNDLVIFSQAYNKGDILSTNSKLRDVKVSYDFLTWPFPVKASHFRFKTLWQVQYIDMQSIYDAPVRSGTPDSSGNYAAYATNGCKGFIAPSVGVGVAEYDSRNFRLEANLSGFAPLIAPRSSMATRLWPTGSAASNCASAAKPSTSAAHPNRTIYRAQHRRRLRRHPLVLRLKSSGRRT